MKANILLTLLLPLTALAGTAELTATMPTENTDSTAIEGQLAMCWHRGSAEGTYPDKVCEGAYDPGSEASYTWMDLPSGLHYFVATARNAAGVESSFSNVASKDVSDSIPLPPGGVAVAGETAYIIVQSEDTFVLLPIGTISADTSCSADVVAVDDNGVTAYKVAREAVTPYSPGQELVVTFATCGN